MNLFTIPRFVTEQTIEREKDSRRNGSTIETVLPEPLPPTTRILLFSPVFRQSVLKMQPSPRIMRSALSGYFAGMFKDRILRFTIALILPCF